MIRNAREAVLSTVADFFTGMVTAWVFAAIDSLYHLLWLDLLSSLFLAILSLSAAVSANLHYMLNIHDFISGGLIGVPLIVIAFVLLYIVFWRHADTRHGKS